MNWVLDITEKLQIVRETWQGWDRTTKALAFSLAITVGAILSTPVFGHLVNTSKITLPVTAAEPTPIPLPCWGIPPVEAGATLTITTADGKRIELGDSAFPLTAIADVPELGKQILVYGISQGEDGTQVCLLDTEGDLLQNAMGQIGQ